MRDYYNLILSVYANDTQAFTNFVTKEYSVALNCKDKIKSLSMFRAIKEQLLLIYNVKVEGVYGTPSEIVELLVNINAFLDN